MHCKVESLTEAFLALACVVRSLAREILPSQQKAISSFFLLPLAVGAAAAALVKLDCVEREMGPVYARDQMASPSEARPRPVRASD